MLATIVSFALYLVLLIAIGLIFYEKKSTVEKYLLGGRGLGSWVTAMSAQASDMSGWLLMGLPGTIYFAGIGETWCAIGLALGTFFNWILVAPRLRVYTEVTNSMTVPSFMGDRFRDPTGILRVVATLVTLVFFIIYAGSGLVAAGKLFESIFHIRYEVAVVVGGVVVVFYTLCGGFLAVCWTDLIQGILMFIAIVIVPILAVCCNLQPGAISANLEARQLQTSLFPNGLNSAAIIAAISSLAWGLGYFGQPHIVVRFMGIRSHKDLTKATTIAMTWVIISLAAAIIIGFIGVGMYEAPVDGKEAERVFIRMISDVCNPWIGGIFLAAILAAIMSTIDSQLLSASSSLSQDIFRPMFCPKASEATMLNVNRCGILLITVLAFVLALLNLQTIFKIVAFAWGGFGAAFGPVILVSLYSRKMTWQSALSGMLVGTIVMLTWKFCCTWGPSMYEILPGFFANLITIIYMNAILPQKDEKVLAEFDKMRSIINDEEVALDKEK